MTSGITMNFTEVSDNWATFQQRPHSCTILPVGIEPIPGVSCITE